VSWFPLVTVYSRCDLLLPASQSSLQQGSDVCVSSTPFTGQAPKGTITVIITTPDPEAGWTKASVEVQIGNFWLHRPYGLCHNRPAPPFQRNNNHRGLRVWLKQGACLARLSSNPSTTNE
jgi:hypothetical protein